VESRRYHFTTPGTDGFAVGAPRSCRGLRASIVSGGYDIRGSSRYSRHRRSAAAGKTASRHGNAGVCRGSPDPWIARSTSMRCRHGWREGDRPRDPQAGFDRRRRNDAGRKFRRRSLQDPLCRPTLVQAPLNGRELRRPSAQAESQRAARHGGAAGHQFVRRRNRNPAEPTSRSRRRRRSKCGRRPSVVVRPPKTKPPLVLKPPTPAPSPRRYKKSRPRLHVRWLTNYCRGRVETATCVHVTKGVLASAGRLYSLRPCTPLLRFFPGSSGILA